MGTHREDAPDPNRAVKIRLSQLIRGGLRAKNWTLNDLDEYAREKSIRGFSKRNMEHYVSVNPNYKLWPPKLDLSMLATVLDQRPKDWEEVLGLATPDSHPFYVREEIFANQRSLQDGDEVWVVSCRGFLENEDAEIADMVRANLGRGVTYKYFFPVGDRGSHPFGNVAAESYASFRQAIANLWGLPSTPRIVGFGVDTKDFPFFSRLHTLICFRRKHNSESLPLVFIEYDSRVSRDGSGAVWYRLKQDDFNAVAAALIRACDPIADQHLPLYPMNPRLSRVAREYKRFFQSSAWTNLYLQVRGILDQTTVCVSALSKEIGKVTLPDHIRCLDVGCGDGVVTAGIVEALLEAGHEITLTLLDPSSAQLRSAEQRMNVVSAGHPDHIHLHSVNATLEEATLEGYDLIIAVHSLYVIDEVYLRKIYHHLNPSGLVCIWLGSLNDNVLNQICNAVDASRGDQRRNFAEDVYTALELFGLANSGLSKQVYATAVSPLIDPEGNLNDAGRLIAEFFAMHAGPPAITAASAAACASWTLEGHPVTDLLISFRRSADTPK